MVQGLLVAGLWFFARSNGQQETRSEPVAAVGQLKPLPAAAILWLLALVVGTFCLKEAWYGYRERGLQDKPQWEVAWEGEAGFKEEPLSAETIDILKTTNAKQVIYTEGRQEWTLFFMKWKAGKNSLRASRAHNPTVCLPASGFKLQSKGFTFLPCRGLMMPFETFTFEANQRIYYVFYCLWEDSWTFPREAEGGVAQRVDRWWRLQVAWRGKRNLGQQAFEVAMTGYQNLEEASNALANKLPQLIKISK
jgi:hypothetical protein